MKQLGLAFIQYTQDGDEKLPNGSWIRFGNQNEGVGWAGQLYSYTKSTGLYKCPDDSTAVNGAATPVSYSYNGLNICRTNTIGGSNASSGIGSALSAFNSSAKTVLLYESSNIAANVADSGVREGYIGTNQVQMSGIGNGYENYSGPGGGGSGSSSDNKYATGRDLTVTKGLHTEGANYLLSDGHVKWLRSSSVSYGVNAVTQTDTQNNDLAAGTGESTYTVTFSAI